MTHARETAETLARVGGEGGVGAGRVVGDRDRGTTNAGADLAHTRAGRCRRAARDLALRVGDRNLRANAVDTNARAAGYIVGSTTGGVVRLVGVGARAAHACGTHANRQTGVGAAACAVGKGRALTAGASASVASARIAALGRRAGERLLRADAIDARVGGAGVVVRASEGVVVNQSASAAVRCRALVLLALRSGAHACAEGADREGDAAGARITGADVLHTRSALSGTARAESCKFTSVGAARAGWIALLVAFDDAVATVLRAVTTGAVRPTRVADAARVGTTANAVATLHRSARVDGAGRSRLGAETAGVEEGTVVEEDVRGHAEIGGGGVTLAEEKVKVVDAADRHSKLLEGDLRIVERARGRESTVNAAEINKENVVHEKVDVVITRECERFDTTVLELGVVLQAKVKVLASICIIA